MSDYVSEYAKGEILVEFEGIPKELAKLFGERLGYTFLGVWPHGTDVYIFKTKEGLEQKACEEFQSHDKFVGWAERRDIKREARQERNKKADYLLKELSDDCVISDEEDNAKIQEIVDVLEGKE